MQAILKNPIVANFLDRFKQQDHLQTIKDLVLIGIDLVMNRLKEEIEQVDIKSLVNEKIGKQRPKDDAIILREIELIKREIQKINRRFSLSNVFQKSNQKNTSEFQDKKIVHHEDVTFNKDELMKNYFTAKQKKKNEITPKVTQVYPEVEKTNQIKRVNKHHLDDHQLKQILTYSNLEQKETGFFKKQNQTRNLHNNQTPGNSKLEEKRKDTIPKISELKTEKSVEVLHKKRSPEIKRQNSGPKYLKGVESKIKDIIKHDKLKMKQSGTIDNNIRIEAESGLIKSKLIQNKSEIKQKYRSLKNQDRIEDEYNTRKVDKRVENQKIVLSKPKDENSNPYNNNSNIEKAHKFLNSPIGKKYFEDIEHSSEEFSENDESQFSVFNPDERPLQRAVESSSSFSVEQNSRKRKEVGKISRRRER